MIRRTALLVACVVFVAAVPADAFDLNLAVGADFGGDFDLWRRQSELEHRLQPGPRDRIQGSLYRARGRARVWVLARRGHRRLRRQLLSDLRDRPVLLRAGLHRGPVWLREHVGVHHPRWRFQGGGSWGLGGGVEFFGKLKTELLFNSINGDLKYQSWTIRLLYTF